MNEQTCCNNVFYRIYFIALREKLRKRRLLLRLGLVCLLRCRFIADLGSGCRVGIGERTLLFDFFFFLLPLPDNDRVVVFSLETSEFFLIVRSVLDLILELQDGGHLLGHLLVAALFNTRVPLNLVSEVDILRSGRDDHRDRAVVAPRHGKQSVEGVLTGALEIGVAEGVEVGAGLDIPCDEHILGDLMNYAFVYAAVEFPIERDVSDLLVDVGEPDVVVMLGRGTTARQEREQVCGQPARHASVELLQECLLGGGEEVVFDLYSERHIGVPHAHRLVVFLVGVEVAQQDDILALLDGLGADALDERCLDHILIRCFKLATSGGMTNDDVDVKR